LLLISFFSFQKLTRQAIMIVLPFTASDIIGTASRI